jgi:hypothetical protein
MRGLWLDGKPFRPFLRLLSETKPVSQLTNELSIQIELDNCGAVVICLYDANGLETTDPRRAVVAVGEYTSGDLAGTYFVLEALDAVPEIRSFRTH